MSLFLSKEQKATEKYEGVFFPIPRKNQPLFFKLFYIDLKNKKLKIFDPSYSESRNDKEGVHPKDIQEYERILMVQVL